MKLKPGDRVRWKGKGRTDKDPKPVEGVVVEEQAVMVRLPSGVLIPAKASSLELMEGHTPR